MLSAILADTRSPAQVAQNHAPLVRRLLQFDERVDLSAQDKFGMDTVAIAIRSTTASTLSQSVTFEVCWKVRWARRLLRRARPFLMRARLTPPALRAGSNQGLEFHHFPGGRGEFGSLQA